MSKRIGKMEAEEAYRQGADVWLGKTSVSEAVDFLVSSLELNRASATDLIRNLLQMLKGDSYHRTLSEAVTRHFFERICLDFGTTYLERAIISTLAHIEYYESLSSGSGRPGLRKVCAEFQRILSDDQLGLLGGLQDRILVANSRSPEERRARIEASELAPKRILSRQFAFFRNADVVAERLFLARGVCDRCARPAPFKRKSDGSPYLEVHHIVPLSEGGLDSLENTQALCPNCHREVHFGILDAG